MLHDAAIVCEVSLAFSEAQSDSWAPPFRRECLEAPPWQPSAFAPAAPRTTPFPRAVGPLARWRKEQAHIALRADGSVVRHIGSSIWNVITLKGKAKKGLTVDEVHEVLAAAGYTREATP